MYDCELTEMLYRKKTRQQYEAENHLKVVPYEQFIIAEKTDYLPDNVLGMTDLKKIWIRPPESQPYGFFGHVLNHEIEHILDPFASENRIDRRAADSSRNEIRRRVRLSWYN
ncbi:MAG: hypothetical protein V1802_01340 [Candidatus Aenigmatarchaeota archaeon]